jgi:hypothetical protein
VLENGIEVGAVSIRWVSRFFRRAKIEIAVLIGSVAAGQVPDPSGAGSEWFDTLFAKIGWDLSVVSDQTNVAVPSTDPRPLLHHGLAHDGVTTMRMSAT